MLLLILIYLTFILEFDTNISITQASLIVESSFRSIKRRRRGLRINRLQMLGFDYQKIAQQHRFATDFDDLGEIGSGGFAEVRKAKNKIDGKLYAVKITKIKPSKDEDQSSQRLYRALQQARLHAQLSHPQIVKYYGSWMELQQFSEAEIKDMQQEQIEQDEFQMVLCDDSDDSQGITFGSLSNSEHVKAADKSWKGRSIQKVTDPSKLSFYKEIRVYMLSELCQMNLQTFLASRQQQAFSQNHFDLEHHWEQNYKIALDLTKGLAYLHSRRILHRDIKLHNAVISDGRCKIIDFGLSRKAKYWKSSIQQRLPSHDPLLIQEQTFSSSVGTRLFSSPEQANSNKYDHRTDIFSLAMVIVLLFCSFTTAHQQREVIEMIRMRQLDSVPMPSNLKNLMFRSLGPEGERPSLGQIGLALTQLIRQKIKENVGIHPLFERKDNIEKKIILEKKQDKKIMGQIKNSVERKISKFWESKRSDLLVH